MFNLINKYRVFLVYIALIIYVSIIIILSALPDSWLGKLTHIDKLFHFAAYGLFSFIFFFALVFQKKINLFNKFPSTFTLIFTTLFGILNELFQIFVPSRTPNPLDVLANFLGSVIMVALLKYNLNNLRQLKRILF
jgi:VanZ family protein